MAGGTKAPSAPGHAGIRRADQGGLRAQDTALLQFEETAMLCPQDLSVTPFLSMVLSASQDAPGVSFRISLPAIHVRLSLASPHVWVGKRGTAVSPRCHAEA